MRVAEAVGETLAELGVRQVSGLIGSGNFAVTNALVAAGASFVAARHEGAAITIADAYARVSGDVAAPCRNPIPLLVTIRLRIKE